MTVPWLTNLVKTVSKPHPTGAGTELVEEFTYWDDGNVKTHKTYAQGLSRTVSYTYVEGQLTETLFPDVTRPDGATQTGVKNRNEYLGTRKALSKTIVGETATEQGHWTEFTDFDTVNLHGLPKKTRREGGTQYFETTYDVMGNTLTETAPQGDLGKPSQARRSMDWMVSTAWSASPTPRER